MTDLSANLVPDQLLTSREVGDLIQVNPSSVNKWVNEGRIVAFRTPGGHRRIRAGDLVRFLSEHRMPVPRTLLSASRPRILFVEGDPRQLRSLERAFRPLRDRVELAFTSHGVDALVLIGSFKPRVIVLDLDGGGIDGLQVCRRLKDGEGTRGIEVLLASAHPTPELEARARAAGARRCLGKPLGVRSVIEESGLALGG